MTCIVGIEYRDERGSRRVILGGDSAGVGGWVHIHRADPKVFSVGPYVIGFTTSFRMGQIIRYAALPEPPTDADVEVLDHFMATQFINAIRNALKEGGWAQKEKEREDGGSFLVGVRGATLYRVDSDFQVGRSLDRYQAIGSGDEIALGALHATRDLPPEQRVTLALEAAAHHSAGVSGPFTIITGEGVESAVESEEPATT